MIVEDEYVADVIYVLNDLRPRPPILHSEGLPVRRLHPLSGRLGCLAYTTATTLFLLLDAAVLLRLSPENQLRRRATIVLLLLILPRL